MSNGHGWVQRKILEALEDDVWCFLLDMVCHVFDTDTPTNSQYKSVDRSVKRLEEKGFIISSKFYWNPQIFWKIFGIESVKTEGNDYLTRNHFPKWSKIIWLKKNKC